MLTKIKIKTILLFMKLMYKCNQMLSTCLKSYRIECCVKIILDLKYKLAPPLNVPTEFCKMDGSCEYLY